MRRNLGTEICPRCRANTYSIHGTHNDCANCGYQTDDADIHFGDQSPLYREIVQQVDEDIRRFERLL